MNSRVLGLRVASALFGLMCLGQAARLALGLEITVAGRVVPLWPSAVLVVVLAALSGWLAWLSRGGVPTQAPPRA